MFRRFKPNTEAFQAKHGKVRGDAFSPTQYQTIKISCIIWRINHKISNFMSNFKNQHIIKVDNL
jgi:hypothetical protein